MTEEAKRCVAALRVKCHEQNGCSNCAAKPWCMPPNNPDESLTSYAADLIESLFAEMEQVKRERDAAVEEWKQTVIAGNALCDTCKFSDDEGRCFVECDDGENWQWRGVKEG